MLDQERLFYDKNIKQWLKRHPNKFVLVKNHKLIGVYDTIEEALANGARQYGMNNFLVRRVEPQQQEVTVPALTLGLLRADTTHSNAGPS